MCSMEYIFRVCTFKIYTVFCIKWRNIKKNVRSEFLVIFRLIFCIFRRILLILNGSKKRKRLGEDFLKQTEGDSYKLHPSIISGGATIQARVYPLLLQPSLHGNSFQHGDRETECSSASAKSLIPDDVLTLTNIIVSR
jgi:hypothetical protein